MKLVATAFGYTGAVIVLIILTLPNFIWGGIKEVGNLWSYLGE